MTIDELEEQVKDQPKDADFPDSDDDMSSPEEDIREAFCLLKRCGHLLEYVSDTGHVKTLTKRERDAMERMAADVWNYLDELESYYEDEGEEA